MNKSLKKILNEISVYFYPTLCCSCKNERVFKKPICKKCSKQIVPISKPIAQKLQEEFQQEEESPVFIGFIYNNVIQKLLHSLKYKNIKQAGIYIGQKIGELMVREKLDYFDYIIPVPIHKKRIRERGYNQSEIIAIGLSQLISAQILNNIVFRHKYTKSQTELNKVERKQNVKNIFEIKNGSIIKNKNIVLLDDVITTGSTINECAKEIKIFEPNCLLKVSAATPLI